MPLTSPKSQRSAASRKKQLANFPVSGRRQSPGYLQESSRLTLHTCAGLPMQSGCVLFSIAIAANSCTPDYAKKGPDDQPAPGHFKPQKTKENCYKYKQLFHTAQEQTFAPLQTQKNFPNRYAPVAHRLLSNDLPVILVPPVEPRVQFVCRVSESCINDLFRRG